jgi:hypothetical protein
MSAPITHYSNSLTGWNWTSRDGAVALANTIERFWGGAVTCRVEPILASCSGQLLRVFQVRSNLVDGLPPRLASPAAPRQGATSPSVPSRFGRDLCALAAPPWLLRSCHLLSSAP